VSIKLYQGDCLEILPKLADNSVDMVLADPPYQLTQCKWDSIIPLEPMWKELKRIAKDRAAIVMTASQPFTTTLISSNMGMFKYEWIWEKTRFSNQMLAKIQPLKIHENILVFSNGKTKYNPQGLICVDKLIKQGEKITDNIGGGKRKTEYYQEFGNYPKSIQLVKNETGLHPTQKPVALMEYLIKTYTNEGDTVLDFCMGSGTTLVACKKTNRNGIGIEKDPSYFQIAQKRIENTQVQPQLFQEA